MKHSPKLLLIISTITIIAGSKRKQNGCLPLNSGKHPWWKLNYSILNRCPENRVHINHTLRGSFFLLPLSRKRKWRRFIFQNRLWTAAAMGNHNKPRQILSIVSTLNWPPRRAVVWIVEYDIPHFFANTHRFISRACIKSWTRLIVSTKTPPMHGKPARIHLKFIPEQMKSAIMRVRHMRPTEFWKNCQRHWKYVSPETAWWWIWRRRRSSLVSLLRNRYFHGFQRFLHKMLW